MWSFNFDDGRKATPLTQRATVVFQNVAELVRPLYCLFSGIEYLELDREVVSLWIFTIQDELLLTRLL